MANHPINTTRGVSFYPAVANAERVKQERKAATKQHGQKLDQTEQAYRELEQQRMADRKRYRAN